MLIHTPDDTWPRNVRFNIQAQTNEVGTLSESKIFKIIGEFSNTPKHI